MAVLSEKNFGLKEVLIKLITRIIIISHRINRTSSVINYSTPKVGLRVLVY